MMSFTRVHTSARHATVFDINTDHNAATYTLKIFAQFRQFTKDGRVPIDNNALERRWRGVGIGRCNWLFAGSPGGGAWAATMATYCMAREDGRSPHQIVK
jgi:transposase